MGKNWQVTRHYEQRQTDQAHTEDLETAKATARNWVRMFEKPNWIDKTPEYKQNYRDLPSLLVLEGYEDKMKTRIEIKAI